MLSSTIRTLVVTGGSSGIGKEVASMFVKKGWTVHNVSRSPCTVEGVINHKADLSQPTQAESAGEAIAGAIGKQGGGLISVVHSAALHGDDSAAKFDKDLMTKSFLLSCVSPGVLTSKILPHMQDGSSVIFIGSTLSEKAVAGRASYVTSKHAVVGLMKSYVQDLFGTGIHTAVVCPGFTDTPMLREAMAKSEGSEEFIKGFVSVGRLIHPQEIASLVAFAVENPCMNGSILHANGGQKET